MTKRRARALLYVLATGMAVVVAQAGRAADCFEPLAEHDKWACTVELSTGALIPYCLNVTGTSGEGAERTFDMVSSGPYPRVCTCGAKGKGAKARFNTANSYLCFDESTDTAEAGKITAEKLVGQVYNVSVDVRGTFSCVPDPACVVPLP